MASSSSNFRSIFNASLQAYDNKTKNKLLNHPLATQLQSCDSPNAVLTVLQDLVQQFDQRDTSDERLKNWLDPTVNVLYAFSATLGEGVTLVSPNSLSLYDPYSDHRPLGIPAWECGICGDWCPSLGECPRRYPIQANMTLAPLGREGCECKPRHDHRPLRAHREISKASRILHRTDSIRGND